MQWIKENYIIMLSISISLLLHSVIMLYNKDSVVVKENIITFEIIKQVANTQISEQVTENNNNAEEQENVKDEIVKKQNIVEKKQVNNKKTINKQTTPKKDKKVNKDNIKATGTDSINNQAEIYVQENYSKIEKEIVSRIIYPPRAKKLGIEGAGYLLILIDNSGIIVSVQAYDFPNKLLQDAALNAAKKVGYVASHQMANSVEIKVPVKFHLR